MSSSARLNPNAAPALTIRVEAFEGPLALLLDLVERRELAITAISLAAVADQYLDQVRRLDPLPADELAAFLVIAARLLLIKSRALLPPTLRTADDDDDEAGDPAEELARRLREYRQFKQAAAALAERDAAGAHSYSRPAPSPGQARARLAPNDVPPPLTPLPPAALLRALERLVAAAQRRLPADKVAGVPTPQPTVLERSALIESLLCERGRVAFTAILARCRTRREVVVTFLALLDLLRFGRIGVRQAGLFEEIWVERTSPPGPLPDTGRG